VRVNRRADPDRGADGTGPAGGGGGCAEAVVPARPARRTVSVLAGFREPVVWILLAIAFFTSISGKPVDGLLMLLVAVGLAWDAGRGRLLVADVEDFRARLVEPTTGDLLASAELPGRPRWCVYDRRGDRFLVNIREPACVADAVPAVMTRLLAMRVAPAAAAVKRYLRTMPRSPIVPPVSGAAWPLSSELRGIAPFASCCWSNRNSVAARAVCTSPSASRPLSRLNSWISLTVTSSWCATQASVRPWRTQALDFNRPRDVLAWLLRLHPVANVTDFLLDAAETSLALVPAAEVTRSADAEKNIENDWREYASPFLLWMETARQTEPFDPSVFGEGVDPEDVEMYRQEDIERSARDLLLVEQARGWLLGDEG